MIHHFAETLTRLVPVSAVDTLADAGVLMAQAGPSLGSFVPLLLVGAVFLFVVILPQRRQEKQRQARLDALKPGDEVVTRGGIIGKVHNTHEDGVLSLQISDRTRVRVVRSEVTDLYNGPASAGNTQGPAKATPMAESKK